MSKVNWSSLLQLREKQVARGGWIQRNWRKTESSLMISRGSSYFVHKNHPTTSENINPHHVMFWYENARKKLWKVYSLEQLNHQEVSSNSLVHYVVSFSPRYWTITNPHQKLPPEVRYSPLPTAWKCMYIYIVLYKSSDLSLRWACENLDPMVKFTAASWKPTNHVEEAIYPLVN